MEGRTCVHRYTIERGDTHTPVATGRWEADPGNFQQMVEVNPFGLMDAVHAALPVMREKGEDHVVNVSAVAGRKAIPGSSAYTTTKFGVNGSSEALRREVTGEDDIRVALIEPGFVDTELAEQKEQAIEQMDALEPDDIARSIAYAVGQSVHVDVNEIQSRPTEQER